MITIEQIEIIRKALSTEETHEEFAKNDLAAREVLNKLEKEASNTEIIGSVSVSSGVSDLDFKTACHWYNMMLNHIQNGKNDMSVVDEITKELKSKFKRR